MNKGLIKRVVATVYIIFVLFIMIIGFAYSNQDTARFGENFIELDKGWCADNVEIEFPYAKDGVFTIEQDLPVVYGDQFLIVQCFYDSARAFINNEEVYRSVDAKLFGNTSNVGNKEIHVPMKPSYSGKRIKIEFDLQDSLYGSEITASYITTRSGWGIVLLKKNMFSLVIAVVLVFSGIWEILIALHFIIRKSLILRQLSFAAVLYSGFFSVLSGIWLICQSRILEVVFGNYTGFAILEIMAFLLMALSFFELVRAVHFRVSKIDNIIDGIYALMILGAFLFSLIGIVDWGDIVIFAHFIDLTMLFFVGYYTYSSIKEEKRQNERRKIAMGNSIFLLVVVIALAMYINSIDSYYNLVVVIGLMIYIGIQLGVIYRRIGSKVEEEAELVQVKELAYTDELTRLTNRRFFYEEMKSLEGKNLSPDFTIVFFDVNGLKRVNDTLGHDAGDELLVGAAECINKSFKDNSTSIISRMGGDEFIATFIADEKELHTRLKRLNDCMTSWKGQYIDKISMAVGSASLRDYPNVDLNELYKIADDNMYLDKKAYYSSVDHERRTRL